MFPLDNRPLLLLDLLLLLIVLTLLFFCARKIVQNETAKELFVQKVVKKTSDTEELFPVEIIR